MKNKKLENLIRNNVNLDFKDISNKFYDFNYKQLKEITAPKFYKISLGILTVIILFSIYIVNVKSPTKILDKKNTNILYVNDIEYSNNTNNVVYEFEEDFHTLSNNDLIFKYGINIDEEKTSDISCKYDIDNMEQCEIKYFFKSNLIYMNIKENILPLFNEETRDLWNQSISNYKIKKSLINNKEIIILNNTNEGTFISDYQNKKISNLRTKFIHNGIGFAIEGYDIDINTFANCISEIIK